MPVRLATIAQFRHIATGAGALVSLMAATVAALGMEYNGLYFAQGTGFCTTNVCAMRLPFIPGGKYALIDRVSCTINTTFAAGTGPSLLAAQAGRAAGAINNFSRGNFLAPFSMVFSASGQKKYILNAETANVVLSGEQPVISFLFTAPVNASLVCNQSGQLLANGPT